MSTTKTRFLFLALAIAWGVSSGVTENGDRSTLDYYWTNARSTAARVDPNQAGVSYSYTARSYYKVVDDHGAVVRTDSLLARYYFTDGVLDSQVTVAGESERFRRLDLSVPGVFSDDYHLNFFPNDTGGARLAIGFAADSAVNGLSDGLIVIDRQTYHLRSMYLFYRRYENYKRFTRSLRLIDVGDWVFPDSIWVVATRSGIFSPESFRLETGISEIALNP